MQRLAMDALCKWMNVAGRKPLLITGARQVGKTWLMREFGRTHFKRTAYISFDNNEHMPAIFEGSLSPHRLIPILQIEAGCVIDEHTLLILDEVQEVPRALQSLKYFCEEAPEIPVVAAGSSLGLALKGRKSKTSSARSENARRVSFPVGKVTFLDLYPLTFLEFLLSIGQNLLAESVQALDWPTLGAFHGQLNELLRIYLYVGGMPEVVRRYTEEQDLLSVRDTQRDLLRAYENDFSKYAPNDLAERIRLVWRAIPANLAKENRKFMFSKISKSARAREYEDALQWLIDSSLAHRVRCVTSPETPLTSHEEESVFKVYLSDVGLLGALNNLDARTLLEGNSLFSSYKGSLAEQFALQEILAAGQVGGAHYYKNEKTRNEIDFLVDGNRLMPAAIPIEVKSGENLQAKSLRAYIKKYRPELAIRCSLRPHGVDGALEEVPLYALGSYFRKCVAG